MLVAELPRSRENGRHDSVRRSREYENKEPYMLCKSSFWGFAIALMATVASANWAVAEDDAVHYRAKQVLGSKVHVEGDAAVGTVDDIVLDDHGNVDYLIVMTSDKKLVTVPWDAAVFNAKTRVANVKIAEDQFKKVPTYTADEYPVFSTPAYRTQIYKSYGLTPGQARRAIRRAN
jgi:hypothetical protein